LATNYPSYFFDSRTDSPRQRLAEVLAAPNVGGTAQAGGFSSAGAVRADAPNGGFGAALLSAIQNYQATKDNRDKMALIKGEKANEQALREQTIKARTDFLIAHDIPPENAAAYAADAETFKSVVDQINKPAAKAETQTINNVLYERQADGSWKPVITGEPEKTAFQKDFEYARSQGFTGTPEEWKRSGGTTVNVGNDMKLTEAQSKDIGFYSRGRYADQELAGLDEKLTSFGENVGSRAPLIGNFLKSPEYRQSERAGRDFLAVILRKDTGAAVTPEEFKMYGEIFIPQPGDDVQTLESKRSARARALQALRSGLGTATPLADDFDANFDENFKKTAPKQVEAKPDAGTPNRNPVYNPATGEFE
jgi:hypothetical protein